MLHIIQLNSIIHGLQQFGPVTATFPTWILICRKFHNATSSRNPASSHKVTAKPPYLTARRST